MKKALILLVMLFASAVAVFAEVPNEIRYNEGLISCGNRMNGTLSFNFKILVILTVSI
ncbi:MAG: hypothetical protein LE178_02870 [Endomicrobium sp.]|nr:hypothetical protein [Endomicrobium sp.]